MLEASSKAGDKINARSFKETARLSILHYSLRKSATMLLPFHPFWPVAYSGILFGEGGGGEGSTNSVEDRGQEFGGGSPLDRDSGGSRNLEQEISFHIVKSS